MTSPTVVFDHVNGHVREHDPRVNYVTITDPIVRQAYVCPECECIKDGYDVKYAEQRQQAWCHNYRAHAERRKRKMRPTAIFRHRAL